jgi:hypothetical protein
MILGFKGLKPLDLKPVLVEDRLATAVGAPPPPPPCRDAARAARVMSLPPLPPMSARAMASVTALRGTNSADGAASGHRRGNRSARGVAGEVTPPWSNKSASDAPASNGQDGAEPSCDALRTDVQQLLLQVQSMSLRLADNEQASSEKLAASQVLQKALEDECAQAEAARLEIRNARQRLETFRSLLNKAERPYLDSNARSKSVSPGPSRRRRTADDDLLAQLSLAGAEGASRFLLAEISKAKQHYSNKDVELSEYNKGSGEMTPSLAELHSRLAARREENKDLRHEIIQLRGGRVPTKGGDTSSAGIEAEDVEEVCNADTSAEQSFSPERHVVLKICL